MRYNLTYNLIANASESLFEQKTQVHIIDGHVTRCLPRAHGAQNIRYSFVEAGLSSIKYQLTHSVAQLKIFNFH